MFDSTYNCTQVNKEVTISSGYEVVTFTFAFTSKSNRRYLLYVEEHPRKVCAVKFCPKALIESPVKYNKLTGWECTDEHNHYPGILSTCLGIMYKFYEEDQERSFIFIASPLPDEALASTRRFKLYQRIMPLRFSDLHFRHLSRPEQSIYLMLNRIHPQSELLAHIKEMILVLHPDKNQ